MRASASATPRHMGFSMSTCRPARAACTPRGAWNTGCVQMSIASMRSSASACRQGRIDGSDPELLGASAGLVRHDVNRRDRLHNPGQCLRRLKMRSRDPPAPHHRHADRPIRLPAVAGHPVVSPRRGLAPANRAARANAHASPERLSKHTDRPFLPPRRSSPGRRTVGPGRSLAGDSRCPRRRARFCRNPLQKPRPHGRIAARSSPSPEWRNWQTRGIQNPVMAT